MKKLEIYRLNRRTLDKKAADAFVKLLDGAFKEHGLEFFALKLRLDKGYRVGAFSVSTLYPDAYERTVGMLQGFRLAVEPSLFREAGERSERRQVSRAIRNKGASK
jgi:hypothetical protein